jgi:hypothetical protein
VGGGCAAVLGELAQPALDVPRLSREQPSGTGNGWELPGSDAHVPHQASSHLSRV